MSENQNQDNRSASQKITDLENAFTGLYQTVSNMARDFGTVREAIKLLGTKLDATVRLQGEGQLPTDALISQTMVKINCEDLAAKVQNMVTQGILTADEQVGNDSFIIGEEQNEMGEVINPRLQFAIYAIQKEEVRNKLIGGKVGDVLNLEEGKMKFKVNEVYKIQQNPASPAQADPATTVALAETAPAETAPASN